jgi:hypothetical protein
VAVMFPRREADEPLPGRRCRRPAILAAAAAAVIEPLELRRMLSATVELDHTIANPAPAVGGEFGSSVAARGNWVLIGQSSYDTATHQNVGRALLRNTITNDAITIENPNFADADPVEFNDDQFGLAVAILGNNKVAVSASEGLRNGGTGAVFIFNVPALAGNSGSGTISTASQTWRGADTGAAFGAVLTAYQTDKVLVYANDTTPDDPNIPPEAQVDASGVGLFDSDLAESAGTLFFARPGGFLSGATMAVDGDNVLLSYFNGSSFAVDLVGPGGSVVEFDAGPAGDYIGTYVTPTGFGPLPGLATDGTTVVIGSQEQGKVYRYGFGDFLSAPVEYVAPVAGTGTFGVHVAIVGDDHFVVSDSLDSRVYVYEIGGNTAPTPLGDDFNDPSGLDAPNQLGFAVAALSDGRFVATDPGNNTGAADAGVARVFQIVTEPAGPTQPIELFEGILYVTADDPASISITGDGTFVTVKMGAESLTVAVSLITGGRIEVRGSTGADVVSVAASVKTNMWVFGNAGNDSIRSGGGNDVIIGGDGADLLVGGNGRDLIIGGDGADRIVGEQEDDILVAGTTAQDGDQDELGQIMAMWTSSLMFEERVDGLRSRLLYPPDNVFDDGDIDVLTGSSGSDWFLFTDGLDVITDLKSKDFADDLGFITAA